MKPLHTRVAPSPTGFFHLGTARTALHNYLLAKATGGTFQLRIDDTDLQRNQDAYVDVILDALQYLGIVPDSIVRQSDRFDHYRSVAQLLSLRGRASQGDDGVIRLNAPSTRDSWSDFYGQHYPLTDKDRDLGSHIALIKSDGTPTYHFSCVVDDMDFGRNLIVRGADHIPNTSKQVIIGDALRDVGYSDMIPDFIHVGLIMKDKKKLSKRDGASNMLAYRDDGVAPMALWNFLLKLGWGHSDPQFDKKIPILTQDDMIQHVMNGKFRTINCNFDTQKLQFYIKKCSNRS